MKQILVVEDDKILGEEIVEALTDAGYKTFLARSGEETFKALEAQEVGLILLDIMIVGDIDGYEVLRKIKNEDRWKDLPVVMLTNLGQMNEIDRAMEIGATDYVVKANVDLSKLVGLAEKYAS